MESAGSFGQFVVEFSISEVPVIGAETFQGVAMTQMWVRRSPNCGNKTLDKIIHMAFGAT